MHILVVMIFGLAALAFFWLTARLLNRGGWGLDGALIFIPVWLLASLLNAAAGVFYAGIPFINEVAAFVPIFGIPAGAAWLLSRRRRAEIAG